METPILDLEDYSYAYKLYGEAIQRRDFGMTIEKSFKTKLNYYKEVTGFEETEPNSIMHYRIGQYTACKN
ncbi:hypothetical protein PP182_19935 [Maribacter sp. PR1]|nr:MULTISPECIES: hypothetical protein [Maribacter]MDC6390967.1 hypothetical protein [Maribacter sp. PR1]